MKIFYFLKEGFKMGKKIYTHQKEPWVQDILAMCRAVGNEAEKFRGILRFSELEDGMLYAVMKPTMTSCPFWQSTLKNGSPRNGGPSTIKAATKRRSTKTDISSWAPWRKKKRT